ncbi:LysR family transcriptional regulator [Arthrobacter agilis]|nr:LysR family transcriptional regulator [Arthrobacter agilis]
MPKFSFRHLELFAALSEQPTLSAAAALMHISESGLSHAITDLEAAVGEQLCVRRKARGVQLTPAGLYFAERAKRLLREAEGLASDLGAEGGQLRGPVSIGCYSGLGSTLLPPLLEGFREQHPNVELITKLGSANDLVPALESGTVDLAFLYNQALPPSLAKERIYDSHLLAILPEGHRLAQQDAIDLKDLVDDPLIMMDLAPSAANTMLVFHQRGLKPNVSVNVPQIDLVRTLVARGLGYSLLMSRPRGFAPFSAEGKRLVARPLAPRAGETQVVVAWLASSDLSTRARAVKSYTLDAIGNLVRASA